MIKLLAIDMDGTLLNSFSKLSKVNLSALYRAKEAGIEIVPTTGRTLACRIRCKNIRICFGM